MKDSAPDTKQHIMRVQQLVFAVCENLANRAVVHDESKLQSPEKEAFDEATALKDMTYGSDEYKAALQKLGPALEHHYEHNRHHPEHYGYFECNGCFARYPKNYDKDKRCAFCGYTGVTFRPDISGMSLLDLIEMLADWKAAGERHADGSMVASLEKNQMRFEITPQLQRILANTAKEMGWL